MTRDLETRTPEESLPASPSSLRTAKDRELPGAEGNPLLAPGTFTFWRGRVALYAILKSLGIGPGDSVLVPGYTCFAVPAAVIFAGARPLYVDIDRNTFNISFSAIRSTWNEHAGENIKAILVQHTYGLPADLGPIVPWAREHRIAVIEDCAHAWGSRHRNQNGEWMDVGTAGDAAFFSSQWTKPVSTGLGGWAKANDPELAMRLGQFDENECLAPSFAETALLAGQVALRGMFSSSSAYWTARRLYQRLYRRGLVIGTSTPAELQGKMPSGFAKRMSGFQRWLLSERLADTSVHARRRNLKTFYDAALQSAGLLSFHVPGYADPVLLRYPVRVRNKKRVLAEAERRRIEVGDWYAHPIDRPEGLAADVFAYRQGMCPEGERAAEAVVNLPMHSSVTDKIASDAVDLLREFE